MTNYCQLWLTCADKKEADKITNALLVKHLVACVRQVPVASNYWWQGKLQHDNETMLIMESHLDLFDQVESEVSKLHSYETFVLEAARVSRVSTKAKKWLRKELSVNG